METLPARDTARLAELEIVIERGLKTFDAAGLALSEIRDLRLYKGEFSTFEEYCRDRWGFKRSYAHQLINGAMVMKALPPEMCTIVHNQEQAREVHRIEPTRRVEALQIAQAAAAIEGRHMTARDIRQAIPPSISIHVNLPPPPSTIPPRRIYPEKWIHADPPRIRTATEEIAEANLEEGPAPEESHELQVVKRLYEMLTFPDRAKFREWQEGVEV